MTGPENQETFGDTHVYYRKLELSMITGHNFPCIQISLYYLSFVSPQKCTNILCTNSRYLRTTGYINSGSTFNIVYRLCDDLSSWCNKDKVDLSPIIDAIWADKAIFELYDVAIKRDGELCEDFVFFEDHVPCEKGDCYVYLTGLLIKCESDRLERLWRDIQDIKLSHWGVRSKIDDLYLIGSWLVS